MADAPLADAITYGFGDLGLILFLTWLGPKIMRADLKREAKALEADSSPAARPTASSLPPRHYGLRAYRVENAAGGGLDASRRSRSASPPPGCPCSGCSAADELLKLDPALTLKRGDRLVVSARRGAFVNAERDIGPEIDDPRSAVGPDADGGGRRDQPRRERQDARRAGTGSGGARRVPRVDPARHRAAAARTVDGPRARRHPAASSARPTTSSARRSIIGFVERDLATTDLTFLAGGICAGMLLGLLKLNAGGIVLGLGTAGSILVVGLVGRLGAQPLPGVRRDSRAGAAAADGHRPDRLHRGGRDARRTARRRGVSRRAAAPSSPASSSPA